MGFGLSHTLTIRVARPPPITRRRAGEDHWMVKHSDDRVEAARILHDEDGWGYRRIARHLGLSLYTVKAWCKYRRR